MNKKSTEAQAQMAKFNIAKLLEERFAKALWETKINFSLTAQWIFLVRFYVLENTTPSALGINPMQFRDLVKKFLAAEGAWQDTLGLVDINVTDLDVNIPLNLAEFAALSNFLETLPAEKLELSLEKYADAMVEAYDLAVKWNEQAAAVRKATEEAVIAEMQGEKAEENVGTLKAVTAEA